MNAKDFSKLLVKLDACSPAREWAKGKSLAQAWAKCVRADWMFWLMVKQAGKPGWPDKSIVRHALCDCAETALPIYAKYYPNDDRPANAIRVSRAYADGKATAEELAAARDAARAAARAAALKLMAGLVRKRCGKFAN